MTRSLLIVAASLLVGSTAWAVDAPIQPGGGNNVNAQFRSTPAPAPASAPAPAGIADHAGPINAPIQPGGGNAVGHVFDTPPPAPAPAATPAAASRGPINAPIQPGGGNNVNAQFPSTPAPAPAATPGGDTSVSHVPFNAGSYTTASECMTAASAAHQALLPCESLRKK